MIDELALVSLEQMQRELTTQCSSGFSPAFRLRDILENGCFQPEQIAGVLSVAHPHRNWPGHGTYSPSPKPVSASPSRSAISSSATMAALMIFDWTSISHMVRLPEILNFSPCT